MSEFDISSFLRAFASMRARCTFFRRGDRVWTFRREPAGLFSVRCRVLVGLRQADVETSCTVDGIDDALAELMFRSHQVATQLRGLTP